MIETIHIYHTNDLHSHLENWPTIHQFLSERRKSHSSNDSILTLDIGDHIDRSNVYTEGLLGKGNVQLLNKAKYDYVTIGNNEGITLSHEELNTLYEQADFEVIISNFVDRNGNIPAWVQPYKIHITPSGIRIGIVAATADYGIYYENLGWHVQDPIIRLTQVSKELRAQVDVIICMSHLGKTQDEIISKDIPEIDLILGAHTHHFFEEGKWIGNTLQAAAGKYGAYVGYVTLDFHHISRSVVKKAAVLYPVENLSKPKNDLEQQDSWQEKGFQALAEPVFCNPLELSKDWFNPSSLSKFFGEALLAYTGADCAMFPAGIFLSDLPKGEIKAIDLHQCLPHPINPCIITLSGAALLEVVTLSKNDKWPLLEVKGLGFRGKYLGSILFEHLREVEGAIYINEKPLNIYASYKLATLDMFTFGYFFPSLKTMEKQYFMPEVIRDIVKWYGLRLNRESRSY